MYEYKDKNILVLGLARSGLAAIRMLLRLGARVTVSEKRPPEEIKELSFLLENGVRLVDQQSDVFEEDFDEVIKNPGISSELWFVKRLLERGIPVITEIELAFRVCAKQHYIAVTGTNGKTTTATLLYEVIKKAHPDKTHLSGNIGVALCDTALEFDLLNNEGHYIVLEISNFQLLDIKSFRPEIAVIINLAPDHLDFMGTEDAYYRSKVRVYENMGGNDVFLKNADDAIVAEYTERFPVPCRCVTYSINKKADVYADFENVYAFSNKLMPISDIKVVGRHNVQNVLVAVAAALSLGIAPSLIASAVSDFGGVEHRIEYVRELRGIKFYNDSKGTNVDATVIALRAFSQPTVLLAGGHEKGLPLDALKSELSNVKLLVGYGECGKRIVDELSCVPTVLVKTLDEAVARAMEVACEGDVILLSPTTSSFDQYPDFETRGKHFKQIVNELE